MPLFSFGGDSSLICSETTAAGIDQEVKAIISTQQERARQVIRDHRDKVLELTDYLLEKETITGDQFMEILHS